jgi:class 3 adenylate cyclase/tetratricopeptide (TPR) repeat protein
MTPVAEWLKALDLDRYASVFSDNEVDFQTLQVLTDNDLKELGLPFGPRKRILNAIAEARQTETKAIPQGSVSGERRQLTVLFCDMVGFTELAHRVDPEVLQNIIRSYEDACAVCITRYEGYVFQRLGDGIVAFFGYPLAHEGEAERAIRAGLEIVETMARLAIPDAGHLRVRIGIAAGIVVVASSERGAVGETMNLAARLQGVAEPDSIVVSERVRRLAGGAFEYDDLGEHDLKGIARPTHAYRVRGVGAAETRFEAATSGGMTPLVGRVREFNELLDRWQMARDGAGQAVVLSGEPGIGKSRILNALREQLEEEGIRSIRFQCSPFHTNSAFHPISACIERALEFAQDESAASRLNKIRTLVVERCGQSEEDVRFVATMLSVPCDEYFEPLKISPRLVKAETNRVLIALITAIARRRPTLLMFEDLHWADPTSLEVLEDLIEQLKDIPLLALLTCRPEFQPGWAEHSWICSLNLGRLTPAQSGALILRLSQGKALPSELAGQIVAKTDGVPLFVEELTRAILESGDLIERDGHYAYKGTSANVAIPETLRDSLTARLDRVPAVKEVAQAGAAIGREFSYELISALDLLPPAALDRALLQLTESDLASYRGTSSGGVYTFRHALIQDTAYDSLLRSQRQPLHERIARVMEERWPKTRDTEPELLAHHYTAAGLTAAAVPFWRRAGDLAMKRFALTEAVTHLRKGMALTETLPPSRGRDLEELGFRTALAPALIAQRGWGYDEIDPILESAWALAESLDHRSAYVPVLSALCVHHMCVDHIALSLEWAEKLRRAGKSVGDDSLEIVGHRAASASYYWKGDFTAARRHGDMVLSLYDSDRHWHIAQLTNYDPLTGEGIYRGQYLWMLGYPDQAAAASNSKDAHARRRNHPFDLAFALTLGAQVFDHLAQPDELLRRTEEAERVGREYGVALLWEVMAEISRGIAWLRAGRAEESVDQLGTAIARLRATGHRIWIWYLRALQAEGLAISGDLIAAEAILDESISQIEKGEERAHYSEVLRLQGWLRILQNRQDEAEADLRSAIEIARTQRAKSWELRSATTLASLLAEKGDTKAAWELLAPIYGWFTEGFGTADLIRAKALLEAVKSRSGRTSHAGLSQ